MFRGRLSLQSVGVVICINLFVFGTPATDALAQSSSDRDCRTIESGFGAGAFRATPDNTFEFNHRELSASRGRLYVLRVDDGGYFQILFTCTAPSFFNYSVTGDPGAQPASTDAAPLADSVMVTGPLTIRGITMRHDARFLRYRVSARLREGVQSVSSGAAGAARGISEEIPPLAKPPGDPRASDSTPPPAQLFAVSFDVWVVTKPEWRLSIIGGAAVSSLVDTKYAIATDAQGAKIFVESPTGQSSHATDVMALANTYYSQTFWRTLNFGAAFGFGSGGTSPRFFLGPSVIFGKYFVFTGGWSIGSVAAPPLGQELSKAPVNGDNTLNSLTRRVIARPFFGIGFTWIDRRDQFAAAFSAAASASGSVGSCVASVTPAAVTFDAKGVASADVVVEAGADCTWVATLQNGTNLFEVTGGGGKGKGTIKLKTGEAIAAGRSDVLNIVGPSGSAAKPVKLTQPPAK
jgi:hypothetical protein